MKSKASLAVERMGTEDLWRYVDGLILQMRAESLAGGDEAIRLALIARMHRCLAELELRGGGMQLQLPGIARGYGKVN